MTAAGKGDPSAEVGTDRAAGSVVRGKAGRDCAAGEWATWGRHRCAGSLHRDRERQRGYNQAGRISKPLARKLGLPHEAVLLMRTRPRPGKQVLSLEERWESVRGAFATRPDSQVDNKRVLLVDDVMTTGATLDACARALLEAGAKSVLGLTIARAARSPLPAPDSGNL
jgi:hypothetical protein